MEERKRTSSSMRSAAGTRRGTTEMGGAGGAEFGSAATSTPGGTADQRATHQENGGNGRGGFAERIREGASAQLSSQKERATEGLGSIAQAVRQSTEQLRSEHHETVAQYVEQAANQIERWSNQLREKDLGELVEDAQRLARRQPALFIGSAFALGLLSARFFKSSPERAHRHDWRRPETPGGTRPFGTGPGAAGSGIPPVTETFNG